MGVVLAFLKIFPFGEWLERFTARDFLITTMGKEVWRVVWEPLFVGKFGGYASPQILQEILKGEIQPGIEGQSMCICVLFSDIRDFTTLSEEMAPEAVVQLLNRYLGAMTEAIHEYEGTVIDFMGDGIMAVFGAPNHLDSPAKNALAASRSKLEKLEDLNESLKSEGINLRIGIGLHMGDAVVGNIGSEERYQYTAIGDVINTASRLEGLTKRLGYPIVLSSIVADSLHDELLFDDLGEVPVKGRAPVHVFGWPSKITTDS